MQAMTVDRSYKKLGTLANVILFMFAAVFAVPFMFALYDYQHYNDAPSSLRFVLFYLLPAGSLITVVFAIFLKPIVKIKIVLVGVICLMGLYFTEAILTVSDYQRTAEKANQRTKLEEVLAQRENGIDAYPSIHPRDLLDAQPDETLRCAISKDGKELLPLGGISNTTTVTCNESGEYLIYDSDEHGMHNPPGIWEYERLDVVAVGDSFTQGYCVRSDEGYVSLIRQEHSATLNLGMAGNGPLLMLASILEFAPEYKPKHVLWFHFEGNDFHDLEEEKTCGLLMRYLNEDFSQGLRSEQPLVDRNMKAIVEANLAKRLGAAKENTSVTSIVAFIKLVRARKRMGLVYDYSPITADYGLFREILQKARTTVESWGGTLHMVYLPWSHRYTQLIQNSRDDAPRNQLLTISAELGIPVIDVHLVFVEHPDPLSLFRGHYTAEGNRIVADVVLESLAK